MLLTTIKSPQIERFNKTKYIDSIDPTFIPIHLTGGIGDVICLVDVIRFLSSKFNIVLYTKHVEAFKYFYGPQISIFQDLPNYTWHLELDTFAKFKTSDQFHGFLIKEHELLFLQQQEVCKRLPQLRFLIEDERRRYFLISSFAKDHGLDKRSFPLFSLGFEDQLNYSFLSSSSSEKIITIHDGIDGSQNILGRATKQWKSQSWNKLVGLIKKQYPCYKIIQLGAKASREVEGVDECLINKTSIIEAFDILSKSTLHIDGDSGLVHAAARMKVKCIVLWGPTPINLYSYPQNINLESKICSNGCYGIKENWNSKCVLGHQSPICLDAISYYEVMDEVACTIKTPPF